MNTPATVRVLPAAVALLAATLLLPSSPLSAARPPEPLADVEASADLVTFLPAKPFSQVRVTVSGPDGFLVVATFGPDETPAIELPGADGLYKYELRFSPAGKLKARELAAATREAGSGGDRATDRRAVQRGSFSVAGGSVVVPDLVEAEPKVVLTNADGVVRNSLCVGFDCPNSPLFDDSTILMMENNTRIKFGDTSNAPFPNNDWEIEANSNLSGGAGYLGFNDCGTADNDGGCAADLVFAVEAGARASALYVESDGDVGIGTSNPVLDLHIVTGNTPSLRLDQDGSSGFAPQVWDIAGNETNFFVRDVTAGSRLPLRIRPGAPTSSIDISAAGNVGIGTAAPSGHGVHVVRTTAQATARDLLILQANGPPGMFFSDVSANDRHWQFRMTSGGVFRISDTAADGTADGVTEFDLNPNGNLTIAGQITTSGSCSGGCDRVFDPAYDLETIEEHAAAMWRNGHLPSVGATSEDGPFNLSLMTGGMLNELEKAHIYIEQLHATVGQLGDGLRDRDRRIEELEGRLESLEELISQASR